MTRLSPVSAVSVSLVFGYLIQRDTGDLDLVLFLGSDHSELLRSLVTEEKFFNYGVSGLLPEDDYEEANLALQGGPTEFYLGN